MHLGTQQCWAIIYFPGFVVDGVWKLRIGGRREEKDFAKTSLNLLKLAVCSLAILKL